MFLRSKKKNSDKESNGAFDISFNKLYVLNEESNIFDCVSDSLFSKFSRINIDVVSDIKEKINTAYPNTSIITIDYGNHLYSDDELCHFDRLVELGDTEDITTFIPHQMFMFDMDTLKTVFEKIILNNQDITIKADNLDPVYLDFFHRVVFDILTYIQIEKNINNFNLILHNSLINHMLETKYQETEFNPFVLNFNDFKTLCFEDSKLSDIKKEIVEEYIPSNKEKILMVREFIKHVCIEKI